MNPPLVSVLIVVRNGSGDIVGTLDSIGEQDYAPLEVIVVDGMSNDGTRELVEAYAHKERRFPIRLVDNPGLIQSSGWNAGIRAATASYVLRLDAVHCRLEPNYVRCCLLKLQQLQQDDPTVAAVGGRRISVAATTGGWGETIARAQSSIMGVGNATYRLSTTAGFADTLGVPLYDRRILLKVGLFNESLGRSEDNELHARLRREGFKLYFLPEVTAIYHPRATLRGVASQMFHNGWWVSSTIIRLHSFPFGIRHVIPFAFYIALVLAGVLSVLGYLFAKVALSGMLALYLAATVAAAIHTFPSVQFWRVAVVFWLMHACYAGGTLAGFFAGTGTPLGEVTAPGAKLGS
jgi:glycosyltransferase involved in cell wall biosynthesis